jgi:excisionase family DNA binding protein
MRQESAAGGRRLNWRQACEALGGCSRSHFYNLVNAGELPALRYGKTRGLWVWEADVRAYLARRRLAQDGLTPPRPPNPDQPCA